MFDHLSDEQRGRIDVNACLRKADLEAAKELADGAEPGEWRVEEQMHGADGSTFRLVRHSDRRPHPELVERASFDLAAKSRTLVPRLLRGIDALERAVATAWGEARSFRESYSREQDAHRVTVERQAKGATGPEHEVALIAQYVALSAVALVQLDGSPPDPDAVQSFGRYTKYLLSKWAGGASVARDLSADKMEWVKREVEERTQIRAKEAAEVADLRAKLKDALERVARGEVPEVLQPALKEAKRRARKAAER